MGLSSATHTVRFQFVFADVHRARIVRDAIQVEVGGVDDDRAGVTVSRAADTVSIEIQAEDFRALRAGCNSWMRLIDVAETVSALDSHTLTASE